MQLETFCLTHTCYDVHELSFKGEDEGLPQMDCGVNSSGMYRASPSHWGCGFRSNADASKLTMPSLPGLNWRDPIGTAT